MKRSTLNAMGVIDVERHFCLHIETNIECLLRLAGTQTSRQHVAPQEHNPRTAALSTETVPCFVTETQSRAEQRAEIAVV
jgi:hypothetical protein